ncbi:MAG: hypothetical protein DMG82_16830 [Acidobacteria bacterium]|nr:MAG: hypothetical protein DMG82_16830 [Acidobacteriota bacterium]
MSYSPIYTVNCRKQAISLIDPTMSTIGIFHQLTRLASDLLHGAVFSGEVRQTNHPAAFFLDTLNRQQ